MCLNCGCGMPDERHGNDANLVTDDLRIAAQANGQDLATTVHNLRRALDGLPADAMRAGSGTGARSDQGTDVAEGGRKFA